MLDSILEVLWEELFRSGIGWVLGGLLFVSVGVWMMSNNAVLGGGIAIAGGILAFYAAKIERGN